MKRIDISSRSFSRRSILVAAPLAAAGIGGCSANEGAGDPTPAPQPDAEKGAQLRPYASALHVHSCFSEGPGSMHAQLAEASRMRIDIIGWTDHDWRMQAVDYWNQVSFEAAVDEQDGDRWQWEAPESNREVNGQHNFGTGPAISGQQARTDCLFLSCEATTGRLSEHRLIALADRSAYRTSLHGQRLEIDVFPEQVSDHAALVLDVLTSYRPSISGRPSGRYRLSYRVGGTQESDPREVEDGIGSITLEAPIDEWTRLALEPAKDISSLWPDIDGRDACSYEISVAALANQGHTAAGYFRSLTIDRAYITGDQPLHTQAALMERYREQYPEITQISGTEISLDTPHLGALAEELALPTSSGDSAQVVAEVQSRGGLVTYNHPFGSGKSELSPTQQDELVLETATRLLDERALGCNLIEVGYRSRGGADLEGHQLLWDTCSRAGIFLTGLGTNDNHTGADWDTSENNFVTWIWAEEPTPARVLEALASGHAFFGDPTAFAGTLDLRTAGGGRMGQVLTGDDHGRALSVVVTGLPKGAHVEVMRLKMRAGASVPDQEDYLRTKLAESDFSSGVSEIPLNEREDSLYRAIVVTAEGQTVALSNPIWLLAKQPEGGIPLARRR